MEAIDWRGAATALTALGALVLLSVVVLVSRVRRRAPELSADSATPKAASGAGATTAAGDLPSLVLAPPRRDPSYAAPGAPTTIMSAHELLAFDADDGDGLELALPGAPTKVVNMQPLADDEFENANTTFHDAARLQEILLVEPVSVPPPVPPEARIIRLATTHK